MEKRVQDYTQEILDTIRSNSSPAVMGSRLEDYHENDLADVLPLLTVPERCKLYRILDTDMLSDIFEYAESDNVAEYLEEMDVKKAASILSKMETDALAEVLQKLDKAKKKLLIELLDPEVRHDIEMIASFDEDEIGSRMTTSCIIIREDLIRDDLDPKTPIYLKYKTHADNDSMYNTPNCWAIYCCGKVFRYLLDNGGLAEMEKRNIAKAKVIYDFLDSSKLFKGAVVPEDRSLMNIPFVTGDKDLDAAVVAASKEAGFDNLKGHKSVGGLRASVYNAMPIEGAEALVEFLKKFEAEHK